MPLKVVARSYVFKEGEELEAEFDRLLNDFHGLPSPKSMISVAGINAKVPLHVNGGFFVARVMEISVKSDKVITYLVKPTTFIADREAAPITRSKIRKGRYTIGRKVWVKGDLMNLVPLK